jgi:regulator of protease activity HflC (stomatin/prohibitin superfamily)
MVGLIVALVVVVFLLVMAARTIRIVPQARAGVVERLGRYQRTLNPGMTVLVPFIDRLKPLIDLREQVVSFPPQPVITQDNVGVQIDTVLYFTVNDAKAVTYEVANPLQAIEQITVTTLRNVIGAITLEDALISRDHINAQLRGVLDEASTKWGIRVNRVELKSIDPPASIQESMEKQMRAERDRRAAILNAEGVKQSAILTAEGQKQAAVLTAEGQKQSAVLRADGEAKAIRTVFEAIHNADPDPKLLSYQYLQMLPKLAEGDANKVFVIPSEFSQAVSGFSRILTGGGAQPGAWPDAAAPLAATPATNSEKQPAGLATGTAPAVAPGDGGTGSESSTQDAEAAVAEAHRAAEEAARVAHESALTAGHGVPPVGDDSAEHPGGPGLGSDGAGEDSEQE